MSIFSSITKRSKLNALIKQSAEARRSEDVKASQLFKDAYLGYAEVVRDDPLRAEALYHWGLSLLHHAKTRSGDEAVKLFQDSFAKFSFCLLLDPNYLAAAIDSGVACMDLARLQGVDYHHELYESARKQFEKANMIQAGAASYNLACIYGLRGSKDACLKALETSRDKALLPDASEILNDPDLSSVVGQDWFIEFMASLVKKPEPVNEAESRAESAAGTVSTEQESEKTVVQEAPRQEPIEATEELAAPESAAEETDPAPEERSEASLAPQLDDAQQQTVPSESSEAEASLNQDETPQAPADEEHTRHEEQPAAEGSEQAPEAVPVHTEEPSRAEEHSEASAGTDSQEARRRDYFLKL